MAYRPRWSLSFWIAEAGSMAARSVVARAKDCAEHGDTRKDGAIFRPRHIQSGAASQTVRQRSGPRFAPVDGGASRADRAGHASEGVANVQLDRIVAVEIGEVRKIDQEISIDLVTRRRRGSPVHIEHEL